MPPVQEGAAWLGDEQEEQGGRVAAPKTLGLFEVSPGVAAASISISRVEVAYGECVWEGGGLGLRQD